MATAYIPGAVEGSDNTEGRITEDQKIEILLWRPQHNQIQQSVWLYCITLHKHIKNLCTIVPTNVEYDHQVKQSIGASIQQKAFISQLLKAMIKHSLPESVILVIGMKSWITTRPNSFEDELKWSYDEIGTCSHKDSWEKEVTQSGDQYAVLHHMLQLISSLKLL